jgi:D-alanine-D-alanine ligase
MIMAKKITIALLFGGRSAEHEVSLRSAAAIYRNLDPRRYRIESIYLDKEGRWKPAESPLLPLKELNRGPAYPILPWQARGSKHPLRPDIYYLALHGPYGEDGTIQGLLELADVPYIGAGVLASATGMDKTVMKILFQSKGLRVSPCRVIRDYEWAADRRKILAGLRRAFSWPVFVKPANLGSSVGISKVKSFAALGPALDLAFRYDRKILVERGISGREIECSVLGNDKPEASLPGEVFPHNDFYDYKDKYEDGLTRFDIPAKLPASIIKTIRAQAVAAFQACETEGLARVDFFLENGTGNLYVNEINTLPGFTEISLYPRLWGVSGLPFGRLLDRLIELGFERHRAKRRCTAKDLA